MTGLSVECTVQITTLGSVTLLGMTIIAAVVLPVLASEPVSQLDLATEGEGIDIVSQCLLDSKSVFARL